MAPSRTPGPQCAFDDPVNVDDGTLSRTESPKPGPLGFWRRIENDLDSGYHNAEHTLATEYQHATQALHAGYEDLSRAARSDYDGAKCIFYAYLLAQVKAPAAILKETGYELTSLLKGLLPGLLQMIVAVGATTILGAAIGGIVGFFFGGAGAAPGVVIGGELGFDLGMAIISWLGLAFLIVSIAKGFVELLDTLKNGIELAWEARNLQGGDQQRQIDRAADQLARVSGILMRLILEAIVAYLLKKVAMSSTRGAMATVNGVRTVGAQATAEASVAELVGKLRASKLGAGFADWVESNWRDLMENPRLRPKDVPDLEPTTTSPERSGKSKQASKPKGFKTPVASELKNTEVNGLKPSRVRPGTNGKVAIVGRKMRYVKEYAAGLEKQGYDVEILDGENIPDAAADEWTAKTKGGTVNLPPEDAMKTQIWDVNKQWAKKLVSEDYTVVDMGNPGNAGSSIFYDMEGVTIFGDSPK